MKYKIFALLLLLPLLFNILNADNYIPYPVIFIHGIGSKTGTWDSTRTNLKNYYEKFYPSGNPNSKNDKGTKYFPMVDYEVRNNYDISKIATEDILNSDSLKTVIDRAIDNSFPSSYTGDKKVILVCHSMGGLVARSLLKQDETGIGDKPANYYRNHIDKIIFIGTPHRGSPLASGMYLLNGEITKMEQAVSDTGDIPTAIYEAQINNQWDKARALQDVKETVYGVIATDNEIINYFKDNGPVKIDAKSDAIKLLVVDDVVTSELSVWGKDPQTNTEANWEIMTNHHGNQAISKNEPAKLSTFDSSITRLITGSAGPDTNIFWECFEVRDIVEMMKFEDVLYVSLYPLFNGISYNGEILDDKYTMPSGGHKVVSRSYTFPDPMNSIDNYMLQGLTDGVVTLASQMGVASDKPAQVVNVMHTKETEQHKEILKFLDEKPPEIEIKDYNGNIVEEGGTCMTARFYVKAIEGTSDTDFSGVKNLTIYRDDIKVEDIPIAPSELEFNYVTMYPFPQGKYTIEAMDAADNISTTTFTINTAPDITPTLVAGVEPNINPTPNAKGWIRLNYIYIGWGECFENEVDYKVSVDGKPWKNISEASDYFDNLSEGPHSASAKGIGATGKESPVKTVTFKVDTIPPVVNLVKISPYAGNGAAVTVAATDNGVPCIGGCGFYMIDYYDYYGGRIVPLAAAFFESTTCFYPPLTVEYFPEPHGEWNWRPGFIPGVEYFVFGVASDEAGNVTRTVEYHFYKNNIPTFESGPWAPPTLSGDINLQGDGTGDLSYTVSERCIVSATINDVSNQNNVVRTLSYTDTGLGDYPKTLTYEYDGKDDYGNTLPSGEYKYTITANSMVTGNVSVLEKPMLDVSSPQSVLEISEPKFGTEPIYVNKNTGLTIISWDDLFTLNDKKGFGVKSICWNIDNSENWNIVENTVPVKNSSFSVPISLLGLPEGNHMISYYSYDTSSNTETVKTTNITIDNTAPSTILTTSRELLIENGIANATASDYFTLTGTDILSGVDKIRFRIDGSSYNDYIGPFNVFMEGMHTIYYYAKDNVDNYESKKIYQVFIEGIPPAPITNLVLLSATTEAIKLVWTAVGDDGTTGAATSYDIRYMVDVAINESNWSNAVQCIGEPTPLEAGNNQSFTINGLIANKIYYFAMKVVDEKSNWSMLSNIANGTPDAIPPGSVNNLNVTNISSNTLTLNWTSVGDDGTTGTATSYDIRYMVGQMQYSVQENLIHKLQETMRNL